MPEIINECEVHPVEDRSFRSAVLKTLIGRQALASLSPDRTLADITEPTELIGAFGVDAVWSELVNDCANRIAGGICNKYTVLANGFSVIVQSRGGHE